MFRTMALNSFKCLIMGAPGSGKGTISSRIIKDFPISYLATGDFLRKNVSEETEVGKKAKDYMDKGSLVPDEMITDIILYELSQMRSKNYLLDGFPRTVEQAKALADKETVSCVVNLDIPFKVIINRLKMRWTHIPSGRIYHLEFNPPRIKGLDDVTGEPLDQRDDDKEETVAARLTNYQKQTQPLLEYYREAGILANFSGKYSNEIWPNVHEFLSTKLTSLQYTTYR